MDDAVRIGAAATALGVSIDTLRRWERAGRVVFERRGGQRYMSAAELADLLRERSGRTSQAQRNRLLLMGLMTRAGWDFYRNEWWHYQLFDQRRYPLISDADLPRPMM